MGGCRVWWAAALRGRRLTAYDLVSQSCYTDDEAGLREYLADFELNLTQLRVALRYCAGLDCLSSAPDGPFCSGCSLHFQQDGARYDPDDLEEFTENGTTFTRSRTGGFLFFGSIEDLLDDEQGRAGWLMAADVQCRFGYLLTE